MAHQNSTREVFLSLGLVEEGHEVPIRGDSSLMGEMIERPLLSPGDTGSSLAKDLGVLVLAFPHLKPTTTSWSGRSVLETTFPPQTDRHHVVREKRG